MKSLLCMTLCFCSFVSCSSKVINVDENAILSLVLEQKYDDGAYTVVDSTTHLSHEDLSTPDAANKFKEYLLSSLTIEGYDINNLIDQLIQNNVKSVTLSLASAPEKGYLIDKDGKFGKYFEDDGGGWEKWYKENPKADGSMQVSRPAIDNTKGLVLIYVGKQWNWLAGTGDIILYEYKDGKLKELKRVRLWVS